MGLVHEHTPDDRGRVSAGNPSLSSEKRRDITERQLTYLYQKACQKEYRDNEQAALKDDNGMDVTDYDQIVGIPIEGYKIAIRLKRLNKNLWFEPSNAAPEQTGVYLLKNNFLGGQEKEFLCGMQSELNPEFSLRVTNDDGTPKGILPGWRRLLMRLIRKNLITEAGANAMFGPPSRDSENWARFVQ